jgi:hypothetical protein
MKQTLSLLLLFLVAMLGFSGAATAQDPSPGRGTEVTYTGSSARHRFEGLGQGQTSGKIWRSTDGGATWYEDGTWSKDGDNIRGYAGGILVFTWRGLGNTSNTTGPLVADIGGDGDTWHRARS